MLCVLKMSYRMDGVADPKTFNRYVVKYDPMFDANNIFTLETSANVVRAKKFETGAQALEYWRQVCPNQPKRPWDGQPNRPLTAYTVEVVNLSEDGKPLPVDDNPVLDETLQTIVKSKWEKSPLRRRKP